MRKTTSGGYFLLHGTGAHQPVPSSEAHSLLHHARQADERALRAVVARHANLAESEGRARGSAGASGRRSDGVDKVQKTFATIWRQTPRATGKNGARSTTFELGGRGGGARKRASGVSERRGDGASIEYRSNVDIRVGFGWVQTARGGAASPRPPRRFDVFALLAPSERGTEEETRYGSARGGGAPGCACAAGAVPHRRNRRHQPFPSIQTPSRSLTTPASAIASVAWQTDRRKNLPAPAPGKGMAEKELASTRRRLVSIERGDAYPDASYPRRTLTGLWSITRASRTRRPLRRYGEPRSRRAPLRGPITRAT